MRRFLGIFGAALSFALLAAPAGAEDDPLDAFLWEARPIVVFADSARDPRFVEQMLEFERRAADMEERDVVILTDTDPDAAGPLRKRLRPRGFQIVLIGKDGEIKLRRPHPMEAEALSRQIDRMPIRRREMQGGQS
ncbi:MAG: DUF4174 domain-containing protein [Pseudomonadota bacterium]